MLFGLRLFDKEGKKILMAGLIEDPNHEEMSI